MKHRLRIALLAAGVIILLLGVYVYSLGPVRSEAMYSDTLLSTSGAPNGIGVVDELYDNGALAVNLTGTTDAQVQGTVDIMDSGLSFYIFDTPGFNSWVSSNFTDSAAYVSVTSVGTVPFTFVPPASGTYQAVFYNPGAPSPKNVTVDVQLTWHQAQTDDTRQTYSYPVMGAGVVLIAAAVSLYERSPRSNTTGT